MKLILIAAVGKNRELGLEGDMPWKRGLKEDLGFFRKTTAGHPMVMGRRTFESLPGLLSGRKHLVITSHPEQLPGSVTGYESIDAFVKEWDSLDETVFVIGGARLYQALLEQCDEMLLTEIDASFPADTWFPSFDPDQWDREQLSVQQDGLYRTKHVRYCRKTKRH